MTNRLLKERIDLLKEIHQNAVKHEHDPGKLKYFMKAMGSVLGKIRSDKVQSKEFVRIAPDINYGMKAALRYLRRSCEIAQNNDHERGKDR